MPPLAIHSHDFSGSTLACLELQRPCLLQAVLEWPVEFVKEHVPLGEALIIVPH